MNRYEFLMVYNSGVRDFADANLKGINLAGVDLIGINLAGANLSKAGMVDANLTDAILAGINLTGASLQWTNLSEADLTEANLVGASLYRANLTGADLRDANLQGADLQRTNLEGANLTGTCLDPANVPNGDVAGFERDGEYVFGYRVTPSPYMRPAIHFKVGRTYTAPYFSTASTSCHPGLYLCPTVEDAQKHVRMHEDRIVKVRAEAVDVHRAGTKWRTRQLTVIRKRG